MDYQIAIPSYQRPKGLVQHTLSLLERMGAPLSRVTIFTTDSEQEKIYGEELFFTYPQVKVVSTDVRGIFHTRLFYCRGHYAPGTRILSMDDDLEQISVLNKAGKLEPYANPLNAIVEMGFGTCERVGAKLWGISAVHNGFYMDRTTTVGLRFICAYFMGCYSDDDTIWNDDRPNLTSCEDFETSLLSYRAHKGVVRLDGLAAKTKFHAPGGAIAIHGGKDGRRAAQEEQVNGIVSRHPSLASAKRKADGFLNVRLKPVTVGKIKWT